MINDQNPRFVSRLTRNTLALILAGGRGSRLKHLTKWRSKPAVPSYQLLSMRCWAGSSSMNSPNSPRRNPQPR